MEQFKERADEFDKLPAIVKIQMEGAYVRENEYREKLEPIYKDFEKSSWNHIVEIMCLGDEYQFVKVRDKKEGKELYTGFINYKPTRRYSHTLDECILDTIAYKHDGPNSQFGRLAANALKISKE